jgi:hypothetical protein
MTSEQPNDPSFPAFLWSAQRPRRIPVVVWSAQRPLPVVVAVGSAMRTVES